MATGIPYNVLRNRVATVDVDFRVDGIRNSGSRICYRDMMPRSGCLTQRDCERLQPFAEMYGKLFHKLRSLPDSELRLLLRSASKRAAVEGECSWTLEGASEYLRRDIPVILDDRESR